MVETTTILDKRLKAYLEVDIHCLHHKNHQSAFNPTEACDIERYGILGSSQGLGHLIWSIGIFFFSSVTEASLHSHAIKKQGAEHLKVTFKSENMNMR